MRFWKCFHVWTSALSTYRQRRNSYWNKPLACSAPRPAASRSWPAARPPSAKTTFTMLRFPSGSARLCCHASIFCCFIRREAHPSCSHSIQGFLPLEKKMLTRVKNTACDLPEVIKVNEKFSHATFKYPLLSSDRRYKGWLRYYTWMLKADPKCQSSSPAHSKKDLGLTGSHTSEYIVLLEHVSVVYPWQRPIRRRKTKELPRRAKIPSNTCLPKSPQLCEN